MLPGLLFTGCAWLRNVAFLVALLLFSCLSFPTLLAYAIAIHLLLFCQLDFGRYPAGCGDDVGFTVRNGAVWVKLPVTGASKLACGVPLAALAHAAFPPLWHLLRGPCHFDFNFN